MELEEQKHKLINRTSRHYEGGAAYMFVKGIFLFFSMKNFVDLSSFFC
jgi:hypothetical protein